MKATLHEYVETEIRGQRFVLRVPHLGDIVKLDRALPVPEIDPGEVEGKDAAGIMAALTHTPERLERVLARFARLLTIVSVEPKIVDPELGVSSGAPAAERWTVPEGAFDVREIPAQHVMQIGILLLQRARIDDGEVVTLVPLSRPGAGGPASSSTASPDATEPPRAGSSSAGAGEN